MGSQVKELLKSLARTLLGDYSVYYIHASPGDDDLQPYVMAANIGVRPVDAAEINASNQPLIRDQAGFMGSDSHAYACFIEDRIAGLCFYWFADRYRKRNFWPLKPGEAKLVQIVTVPEMRGQGVATSLIAGSWRDMMAKGFGRAYARIWHSNTPSLRAFERAGWTRIALVLEINPFRRPRPIRASFPLSAKVRK